MEIQRTSIFTGITRIKNFPITQAQLDDWMDGERIQVALYNISVSDREFIKTGVTPKEWEEFIPKAEDYV